MALAYAVAAADRHGHRPVIGKRRWRKLPNEITLVLQMRLRAAKVARHFCRTSLEGCFALACVVAAFAAFLTSAVRWTEFAFMLIPRSTVFTLVRYVSLLVQNLGRWHRTSRVGQTMERCPSCRHSVHAIFLERSSSPISWPL